LEAGRWDKPVGLVRGQWEEVLSAPRGVIA